MGLMDIRSASLPELEALMVRLGEKSFRAKQIFKRLHGQYADSFDEFTEISKTLRAKISEEASVSALSVMEKQVSKQDGTIKYLFAFENEGIIEGVPRVSGVVTAEAVLMQHNYGNTVCVSSQAGCRMGCKFCASTINGLARNLTAGEMAGQVYAIEKDTKETVSRVVVMGCGEPLDNYENLLRFIQLLNAPNGKNMSQRHMTVSTCGLVPQMRRLMAENLQITLAVSLHAPSDTIRRSIMPVAKKHPMDELLAACKEYGDATKRRVTLEYALIAGVNDSVSHAKELAGKLHHMLCHVNLIPVNAVAETGFYASTDAAAGAFAKTLQERGIEATIRKRFGADIDAACGQLRRKNGYI